MLSRDGVTQLVRWPGGRCSGLIAWLMQMLVEVSSLSQARLLHVPVVRCPSPLCAQWPVEAEQTTSLLRGAATTTTSPFALILHAIVLMSLNVSHFARLICSSRLPAVCLSWAPRQAVLVGSVQPWSL